MTPDQDYSSDQTSFSGSDALAGQVEELIRLVRSGEETNIQLALLLAEGLGNSVPFQQFLDGLLPLYQLAFKSQLQKLNAAAIARLFQLTCLEIRGRRTLITLPESLGELHRLESLTCYKN